jgi:hypothetical protein
MDHAALKSPHLRAKGGPEKGEPSQAIGAALEKVRRLFIDFIQFISFLMFVIFFLFFIDA